MSTIYTNPVRLGDTVVKVNIDTREIMPLYVEMHRQRGALPVVGTTLAMAKALLASGLLAGLIKPPLQHARCWGPGPMAEEKKRGRCKRPSHGKAWHMGPIHHSDRESKHEVRKNMTLQGVPTRWGPQREGARGTCQDMERMQLGGTHLWRPQRKGCLGTWEECNLARGVYKLGPAGGGHVRI